MARPSGHWLAYLRFEYRGETRVLHLLCDTRPQLDEVFGLLKLLSPESGSLAEYAVFHSARNVYVREAPNFPERHILTYSQFMAWWQTPSSEPGSLLERMLEA